MNDSPRNKSQSGTQSVPENMQPARYKALQEVVLGLTSTLELEDVLQRIAAMAQRVAGAAHAHIYL